jgi:dCTP deaminase
VAPHPPHDHRVQLTLFQAASVQAELGTFEGRDYPEETVRLGRLFASLVEYMIGILRTLPTTPILRDSDQLRVQRIAKVLHELHSMVRYLRASENLTTPPALQALLRALLRQYHDGRDDIVIVRPQWKYNCKFVSLSYALGELLFEDPTSLTCDDGHLFGSDVDLLAPASDEPYLEATQQALEGIAAVTAPHSKKPPATISVLSVAGIDKESVFLYPMLAHEVGHLLTYATPRPLHLVVTASFKSNQAGIRRQADDLGVPVVETVLPSVTKDIAAKIDICARELLADAIAVRILGVPFFLGLAEYLHVVQAWTDPPLLPKDGYPSIALRLRYVLDELRSSPGIRQLYAQAWKERHGCLAKDRSPSVTAQVVAILARWNRFLPRRFDPEPLESGAGMANGAFVDFIATKTILDNLKSITEAARGAVPDEKLPCLSDRVDTRIARLASRLPPFIDGDEDAAVSEILLTAWLHRMRVGVPGPSEAASPAEAEDRFRAWLERKAAPKRSREAAGRLEFQEAEDLLAREHRLVAKAIELIEVEHDAAHEEYAPTACAPSERAGGALSRAEILRRIGLSTGDKQRLSVVSFDPRLVQAASLDVRIGRWFKLPRRPKVSAVDLKNVREYLQTGSLHDAVFVPPGGTFIIHPGDFALGITEEFIGMPSDAIGFVEGKSMIGRTGLVVATATQVAPGFHGCVVLELANAGTIPLVLHPGQPIAQLVFISTSCEVPPADLYGGPSDCQIQP